MPDTTRLIMRRFTQSDFPQFLQLIIDKMSSPYAPHDDQFPTDEQSVKGILSYFASTEEFFAVEIKQSHALIGFVALNNVSDDVKNLGYCFHTAYRGKGYAFEAVSALLSYAKNELGVQRVISGTALINDPSVKLLQKLGFEQTERGIGSFVNDKDGNPITFVSCGYSLTL